MKKILSLGAAAAVLSLTAAVASAEVKPVMDPASPVAGDTVTVQIVAEGMTEAMTGFDVKASDNLTFVSAEATTVGMPAWNADTNSFAWIGMELPADGTVLLTLTYTVDAAADEEVSVALVSAEGITGVSNDAAVAVVVDGAATNEPDTSDETSDDTSDDTSDVTSDDTSDDTSDENGATTDENGDGTSDSGLVDDKEDGNNEDGNKEDGNKEDGNKDDENKADNKGNPDTGIALAVVPAVLAGAAIVVAKKRK